MPLIKKCKKCGKEFRVKPSLVRNGNGIFCSRKCSHESMRSGEKVPCFTCGKVVYKTKEQIKRSKSKKYFCGKSCQTKWRNKEFSGERHKNWLGGFSTYREVLLKRGGVLTCALCGITDIRVLAVHHVDKNHSNNDPKNLAWLCHNCHHRVHHGRTSARV